MSEHMSPIPDRLYNSAVGGHVAGANMIVDDTLGVTQDILNNPQAQNTVTDSEYVELIDTNGLKHKITYYNFVTAINKALGSRQAAFVTNIAKLPVINANDELGSNSISGVLAEMLKLLNISHSSFTLEAGASQNVQIGQSSIIFIATNNWNCTAIILAAAHVADLKLVDSYGGTSIAVNTDTANICINHVVNTTQITISSVNPRGFDVWVLSRN